MILWDHPRSFKVFHQGNRLTGTTKYLPTDDCLFAVSSASIPDPDSDPCNGGPALHSIRNQENK